nr:hypothetical protein [Planctomycetota bacterium]
MLRHHLLRFGLLALAAAPVMSADLPIVRITIGPDGALVERAGTLPVGDDVVSGLPVGLDAEHVTLTIAGVDTPPAIRFELPAPVVLPPPDAAWQARLATAQDAFDAAQPAFEVAE